MKKILLILFCMVLLIGTISSLELDNIKDVPQNFNYRKNVVTIRNSFLWIFPLGKVADIQLIENTDQCLINCRTKFRVKLYADYNNPLTRKYFRDRGNKDVDVNGAWYYYDDSSYEIEVPEYKTICELDLNSTNGSEICFQEQIGSHNETKYNSQWLKYEGGTFKEGEYEFEYRGQKPINKDVDFKVVLFGVDLGKEYIWWNNDWTSKRLLSNLTGDIIYMNITYDSDMQTDFDDIRFVDSADETTEYGYFLQKKVDSAWAIFRVKTLGASAIYMYYENDAVSTASNISNVYGSNLVGAWFFDEDTKDYSGFGNDGTIQGNVANASGKVDGGFEFDGDQDYVNCGNDSSLNMGTGDFTLSVWMKTLINSKVMMGKLKDGTPWQGYEMKTTSSDYLRFRGDTIDTIGDIDIVDGTWHHAVGTFEAGQTDGMKIYADGTEDVSARKNASALDKDNADNFLIGITSDETSFDFNGTIDEVMVWDKNLNSTEISWLYNVTKPVYVLGGEEDLGPIIILNSPVNNYNSTSPTITFNGTVYDVTGNDILNVNLILDGVLNETNSSGINNTDYIFIKTIADGSHNWTYEACNNISKCGIQPTRSFNINTTPNIQFENPTPVDEYNSSVNHFIVNVSLTETYFQNLTFYLYNSSGLYDSTTFTDSTRYINWTGLADGNYSYNATIWTNTFQSDSTETRNITIDATAPVINITYPTATVDYHIVNTNLSLNWTVSDTRLDSCWYNYNGTNVSVTCSDNHTNINITEHSNRNVTFYANDTFGSLGSDHQEWDYIVFENFQTFNNETLEGSINTFTANVTIEESNLITIAYFIYNGTPNIGSFSQSGNDFILTIDFLAPDVNTITNLTFFWSLLFLDDQTINLTSHNQTVKTISLDDCSVNTVVIFNYIIVDEANQSQISNTTAEFSINLLDINRQVYISNFSLKYSDINPFAVCISEDLLSSIYIIDSVVKYEAINYSIEYYNIVNATITNSTIPVEITLYDLLLTDATEFKITFKAEDFTFVENALVYIDRQYIAENNTFKTVELPKTDSNGQTIGHFVRNSIIYNIRVIKDGVVLGNFRNMIAFCEDYLIGNCQMILEAKPEDFDIFDYDKQLGIIFQSIPTYNENISAISFDFSTNDGTIKTVSMEVTRDDIFGNRSICNNTLSSSSGTLTCSFDPNIDDSVLRVSVFVDDQSIVLSNVKLEDSVYGNLGYVLWFFLTFFFILLFAHSKTEILIGLTISFIGAISLGIIRGDIIGIGSAGIWLLVIVILGIYKLNKEKPQ